VTLQERVRGRLFVLSALLRGLGLTLRAQRLPVRPFSTADGLADNVVNRIVADSHGLPWFCTAGGLLHLTIDAGPATQEARR
jgi:hypothetical protein